jgi:transposase
MKTNADTAPALYLGLDVHKEQTTVAIADPGPEGEVRHHGSVATTHTALERVVRRIAKARKIAPGDIQVCYEAGGCGMWIARHFEKIGVPCTVIAPSLIPSQSGDKVKTDKKDARKLARLHRAGELTAVRVPDETDEAIRDLCRARVDAHDDLRRARTRVLALLRRLGIHYPGKTHWTGMHWRFMRNLKLEFPAHRVILEEGLLQIEQLLERIERLDTHMELLCESWANKPVVDALMTFRGFKIVAAMMVVSEIGDFVRFTHPRQLMSYLGLVPGEYSSGGKQNQTGITKCGNAHARWILIECATHYRVQPRVSHAMAERQKGKPRWIKEIAWRAQNRLHSRFRTLKGRLMHHNKVKVAVARELTAFIWELGVKIQTNTAR